MEFCWKYDFLFVCLFICFSILGLAKHLVAGTSAGLISTVALHPIDVIKVRMQVYSGVGSIGAYSSIPQALKLIWRSEGWRALYQGLVPALLGSGASWGFYFYFYESAKKRATRKRELGGESKKLGPKEHLIAATESGIVTCFLTNPIWLIKTRMQLQIIETEKTQSTLRERTPFHPSKARYTGVIRKHCTIFNKMQ